MQLHYYAWWLSGVDGRQQGVFYQPPAEERLGVLSQVRGVVGVLGVCVSLCPVVCGLCVRVCVCVWRGGGGGGGLCLPTSGASPWPRACHMYHANVSTSPHFLPLQYYDVPAVSLRAAAHPLMQAGVPGFKVSAPSWLLPCVAPGPDVSASACNALDPHHTRVQGFRLHPAPQRNKRKQT